MNSSLNLLRFASQSIKQEEFYPYIAYINESGRPADVMFGSVIFDFGETKSRLDQWEKVIYSLFRSGENLRALDSAVADVKTLLALPKDYKCDVYISAPIPQMSREYFGDLNGNGIVEKLLDAEGCAKAFSWFADNLMRRFKACGFENINLKGWYMFRENSDLAEVILQKGYDCVFADDCTQNAISCYPNRGDACVFNECGANSLLSYALSEDDDERKVYDCIYNFIKGEPEPASEAVDGNDAPEILVNIPVEIPFAEPAFNPAKEEPVPDACVTNEEIPQEADEEIKPQPEKVRLHKECITEPKDNLKSIVLDIDISTGSPCPPPCQMTTPPPPPQDAPRDRCREKRIALMGAGVAAAVLGIAYLFKKSK